jgi:hypothetical protein
MKTTTHDLLPELIRIVRDAIADGLVRGEKMRTFNKKVKTLQGQELEDYIQRLWDLV